MDDTDATVPIPNIPVPIKPNDAIDSQACDSVASVVQLEWAACYEAEMPQLVRYLMKCSGDSDMRDAADAAQSAFSELFANWNTVHNRRPWLRKVAFRQMLRQHARSEYSLDVMRQEPAVLPASTRLEMREEEQAVLDALRQLPLAQRQVLALICDQFSYKEIAEIMNTNEAAVRQNAARARSRMRELLGLT